MNYEEYIRLKDYSNFASKKIREQQKEIERLQEENLLLKASEPMSKLAEDYGHKAETERLNNIINSMNDYLVMNIANGGLDFMYRQGFKDSYKKLQELKGSE